MAATDGAGCREPGVHEALVSNGDLGTWVKCVRVGMGAARRRAAGRAARRADGAMNGRGAGEPRACDSFGGGSFRRRFFRPAMALYDGPRATFSGVRLVGDAVARGSGNGTGYQLRGCPLRRRYGETAGNAGLWGVDVRERGASDSAEASSGGCSGKARGADCNAGVIDRTDRMRR